MRILEIDPSDDAGLADFHAVLEDVMAHDRPSGVLRSPTSLVTMVRVPNRYHQPVLVAAVHEGRFLGVAEMGFSPEDNTHLADLEIAVRPESRRSGVGRALMEYADRRRRAQGCTTVCGEVHVPVGTEPEEAPGYLFGRAFGFESVHQEDHLVLALPVSDEAVTALEGRVGRGDDYEILSWRDRCPDDLVEAYAALRTQMGNDVPLGEMDYQPVVVHEARIRADEKRTAANWGRWPACGPTARWAATPACWCPAVTITWSRTTPW